MESGSGAPDIAADVPAIEYANPRHRQPSPRSIRTARLMLATTIATPMLGLAILVVFRFSHIEFLPALGMLWLFGGGLMTLICLILCAVQMALVRPGKDDPTIRRIYFAGFILTLLALPVAWFCSYAGAQEMENPYFRVMVFNDTDRPVENVSVIFDDGTIDSGPLAPHASARSWHYRYHHSAGLLEMEVSANGKTTRRTDQIYCDNERLTRENPEIHVEPSELP